MRWAPVPEATVDEDGDPCLRQSYVRRARQLAQMHAEPQPGRVKEAP
jgi:hypothetical protein